MSVDLVKIGFYRDPVFKICLSKIFIDRCIYWISLIIWSYSDITCIDLVISIVGHDVRIFIDKFANQQHVFLNHIQPATSILLTRVPIFIKTVNSET